MSSFNTANWGLAEAAFSVTRINQVNWIVIIKIDELVVECKAYQYYWEDDDFLKPVSALIRNVVRA